MLYIIYGNNIEKKKKALSVIGEINIYIGIDNTDLYNDLSSQIYSQDLWGDKQIIALDSLMQSADSRDIVYAQLESLRDSDNIFIIIENSIHSATLDKLKKFATNVVDATIGEYVNNRGNNRVEEKSPFALCDHIAALDRKRAWLELTKLYDTDVESEPLHGAIWWKLKTVMASSSHGIITPNAPADRSSIISPDRTFDFIMISLRAHNGECDFRREMERWVLAI